MQITIEQIQNKLKSLPEDLQWVIVDAKIDENIITIGRENNLNIEQMGQLSVETYAVILGFISPQQFEASVQGSLKLNPKTTKNIVDALNSRILQKIRNKMMGLPDEESKKENKEEVKTGEPVSSKPEEVKVSEPGTTPNPVATNTEAIKNINSLSAQKLSGSFKSVNTQTDYSLNNTPKQGGASTPMPAEKNPARTVDPYRLNPNE